MTSADLADLLTSALAQQVMPIAQATPRQESTAATPEQVDLAIQLRQVLAEMLAGAADRGGLADRLAQTSGELVTLLRAQVLPMIVDSQ